MPGSITSRITRSKRAGSAVSCASAASPVSTTSTSWCSASRLKRRPSARCCSSSTMRMRLIAAAQQTGNCTVNVLPRPGPSLSANTLPPCRGDHRSDDEQAEARAFDARRHRAGNPVEALEDPLELGRRDADALVAHAQRGRARLSGCSSSTATCTCAPEYLMALSTRFETTAFSSSSSPSTRGATRRTQRLAIGQRVVRQVMARARQRQAVLHDGARDRPARGWRGGAWRRRARRAAPARWCPAAGRCPRPSPGRTPAAWPRRSARLCSVCRYSRIDATGVFSSWVTALMNASCCSLRRISRTRKIVLSTTPVMMSGKDQDAEDQQPGFAAS